MIEDVKRDADGRVTSATLRGQLVLGGFKNEAGGTYQGNAIRAADGRLYDIGTLPIFASVFGADVCLRIERGAPPNKPEPGQRWLLPDATERTVEAVEDNYGTEGRYLVRFAGELEPRAGPQPGWKLLTTEAT